MARWSLDLFAPAPTDPDTHRRIVEGITRARVAMAVVGALVMPLTRSDAGAKIALVALGIGAFAPWAILIGRWRLRSRSGLPSLVGVAGDGVLIIAIADLVPALGLAVTISFVVFTAFHTLTAGWPTGAMAGGVAAIIVAVDEAIPPSSILSLEFIGLTIMMGGMIVVSNRVITEMREAAKRANALNRAKSEILEVLSHDLRSPLTVVRGLAEILYTNESKLDDGARRDVLARILANAERVESLIDQLLDSTTLERGAIPVRNKTFDIAGVARRAIQETISPDREVSLRVPRHLRRAYGDPDRHWQIISNLLSNAAKYSNHPIEVAIENGSDRALTVSIRDNGDGLTTEQSSAIFQPYVRLDGARAGRPGLGLGLHIVKSLVEAQGGTVKVISSPGKGATFAYTVPVEPPGTTP